MPQSSWVCALALSLATASCADGGEGALLVTAYGESFIEQGIPASALADGYRVDFTSFRVDLAEVEVDEVPVSVAASTELVSPSGGEGHLIGAASVPAGAYARARFTVTRIAVEGSAVRDAERKAFRWVFEGPFEYESCAIDTRVPRGGEATLEITVHADHLLSDSLVADVPVLRFEALAAADANLDGEITQGELEAEGLGAYDPGSDGGVDTLWAFLREQAANLGHVDGEGHCITQPAP